MLITFEVVYPFALEDFASGRDRGLWDELVHAHVFEAGELLLHANMPEVSIGGAKGIGKSNRVSRVVGIDEGGGQGGSKGLIEQADLFLVCEWEVGQSGLNIDSRREG